MSAKALLGMRGTSRTNHTPSGNISEFASRLSQVVRDKKIDGGADLNRQSMIDPKMSNLIDKLGINDPRVSVISPQQDDKPGKMLPNNSILSNRETIMAAGTDNDPALWDGNNLFLISESVK